MASLHRTTAKQPHISDIYASQMDLCSGHPLWNPDGLSDQRPVEIGSVGYIHEGEFIELFHAGSPKDDPRNEGALVPENHVPFSWDVLRYKDVGDDMDSGLYSSKSVVAQTVKADVASELPSVATVHAAYTFTVSEENGALLYIPYSAKKKSIQNGIGVVDYYKRHFKEWYYFAHDNKYDKLHCRDMVLVSGYIKTVEWAVAAIRARHAASQAGIGASFSVTGGVSLQWDRSSSSTGCLQMKIGPKRRTDVSASPSPSDASGVNQMTDRTHPHRSSPSSKRPAAPTEEEYDQCIFLKYYKARWRIGPYVLRAGAEPDNLPSDRTGDDTDVSMDDQSEGEMGSASEEGMDTESEEEMDTGSEEEIDSASEEVMDNNPPINQTYSSVDVLLDYILRNSKADVAIACHDDIDMLLLGSEPPNNLAEFLDVIKPRIRVTRDKVGTLNLEDLISKERAWRITSGHPAQTNVPDDTDGDGSGAGGGRHHGEAGLTGLEYGDLLLCNRRNVASIRWPHVLFKDKSMNAEAVSSVALSPDGNLVAAGFDDSNVRLWRCADGYLQTVCESHDAPIWAVCFSPDGRHMVSASEDSKMLVWDVVSRDPSPTPIMALEGHTSEVSHAIYSPDGKVIASASVDCTLKIWDAGSGKCLRTLGGFATTIAHMVFTPDSTNVAACLGSVAKIWNVNTGMELATMRGHQADTWRIAVSHAGDRIATSSEDMTCRVWDSGTGAELVTMAEHAGPIWAIAWSPDDTEIVTGSSDCTAIISDSFNGNVRHTLQHGDTESDIDAVGWSPTGEVVCTGSADGAVRLWDPKSGAVIAEYKGHTDKVKDIIFTRDGNEVITASDDGTVRKWSVQDVLRLY